MLGPRSCRVRSPGRVLGPDASRARVWRVARAVRRDARAGLPVCERRGIADLPPAPGFLLHALERFNPVGRVKRLKVANGETAPFPGRRQESPTVARLGHSPLIRLLWLEGFDDLVATLVTYAQRQADELR